MQDRTFGRDVVARWPARVSWLGCVTAALLACSPSSEAQERRQLAQPRSARFHGFMAGGAAHTLLASEGRVWAWGSNSDGQLGDGSSGSASLVPVRVSQSTGLAGVVAVAAGAGHSVALDSTGHVWTWGANARGQLGDGTNAPRLLPHKLAGIPGFSGRITAIAAGDDFTIAIETGGLVWSWGANTSGQLGDGGTADRNVPAPIGGVIDVKQVSAGGAHVLALDSRGVVWSWGSNARGQLGDGLFTDRSIPGQIVSAPGQHFIEIAAGADHSLSIDQYGIVRAWGADGSGQLGNGAGATSDQPAPVTVNRVNGLDRAVRLAAGARFGLALDARGTLYGWGENDKGQLGDGATLPAANREEPAASLIGGRPGATAIGAGLAHGLSLRSDGRLLAWGDGAAGQLGGGTAGASSQPAVVAGIGLRGVIATSGAWRQSYLLHADGSVWSWGENNEGQLGDGSITDRHKPARIEGLSDTTAIAGSTSNGLVLRSDGTVWGWGKNQAGQVGLPPGAGQDCPAGVLGRVCRPIQIGAGLLTDVKAIDAGTYFNLAVQADGTVWSWGAGGRGQLGRGGFPPADHLPGLVPGVDGAISVAGGGDHALALMPDGTVKAWGRNADCELGTANCCIPPATRCSNPTPQPDLDVPMPVSGQNGAGVLGNITALGAALYHNSLALDANGRVWAWGDNLHGQLGDGNSGNFWVGSFPDRVRGPGGAGLLEEIVAIAGGAHHSLALAADGKLHGWGLNSTGQLGLGSTASPQPFPVRPVCLFGAIGLPAGGQLGHAVIRRDDWTRCGTGLNGNGQLGDGTTIDASSYLCDTSLIGTTLFVDAAPTGRVRWEPSPDAASYRLYHGTRPVGAAWAYTHGCLTPGGLLLPEHVHAASPSSPGDLFFYIAAARTFNCGETHLGRDSAYALRPKPSPCP